MILLALNTALALGWNNLDDLAMAGVGDRLAPGSLVGKACEPVPGSSEHVACVVDEGFQLENFPTFKESKRVFVVDKTDHEGGWLVVEDTYAFTWSDLSDEKAKLVGTNMQATYMGMLLKNKNQSKKVNDNTVIYSPVGAEPPMKITCSSFGEGSGMLSDGHTVVRCALARAPQQF